MLNLPLIFVYLLVAAYPSILSSADRPAAPIDPALHRRTVENPDALVRAWVFFAEKPLARNLEVLGPPAHLTSRAIARRTARRVDGRVFDERDLPLAPQHINAVMASGARVRTRSRWLGAVSVDATWTQLQAISRIPTVAEIRAVARSARIEPVDTIPLGTSANRGASFYGLADPQLTQINIPVVHDLGYTGAGVVVGILDTGFKRAHVAFNEPGHVVNVLAEYDFVDDDPDTGPAEGDPFGQYNHGTYILGVLGAYKPFELVGAAPDAAFILAKTEDVSQEVPAEEDFYVAGLEWIESLGADLATSSLGYINWYTQTDLDGQTAVTTLAVNTATDNGLVCLTAAGNAGNDSNPATSRLIAPADAFYVITCGAVGSTGFIAGFSSDGPTADGRVKPELLALGVNTATVSPFSNNQYGGVSGTSLSTPLVAGAAALILDAHPDWSVAQLRRALQHTASLYLADGAPDPLFVRGFGIVDTLAALQFSFLGDINRDGYVDIEDFSTFAACYSGPVGTRPDACTETAFSLCDLDADGDVDLQDFQTFAARFGN